jgi:hypothetical protein
VAVEGLGRSQYVLWWSSIRVLVESLSFAKSPFRLASCMHRPRNGTSAQEALHLRPDDTHLAYLAFQMKAMTGSEASCLNESVTAQNGTSAQEALHLRPDDTHLSYLAFQMKAMTGSEASCLNESVTALVEAAPHDADAASLAAALSIAGGSGGARLDSALHLRHHLTMRDTLPGDCLADKDTRMAAGSRG